VQIRKLRGSWFKYPLFCMADKVIAISSVLKDAYKKCRLDDEKLCCIPNAVDLDRFSPVSAKQKMEIRKRLKLPEKSLIVTCVASVSRRKGIDFLLKSWEHVMAAHDDVLLVIVGAYKEYDKEFTAQVRELMKTPSYAKKVMLPGMRSDVEKFLQASDMFALTSHREGFATVQIEAMGCGLPCVCTYMEGISDDIFVTGQNGIVVKNPSPEIFAKHVMDVLADPELRKVLGANARESVKQKFSLNQVGDQYLRLYASLMSEMHFEGNLILAQT